MALSVLNIIASHHYSVDKLGTERVIVVTKGISVQLFIVCLTILSFRTQYNSGQSG